MVVTEENTINVIFGRISSISISHGEKEEKIKFKFLSKVNEKNKYDYLHGLYTETWEDLLVTFSLKNRGGVFAHIITQSL